MPVASEPQQSLDMANMELMHNFTTRTFTTLSDNLVIRDFYRMTTVQIGLKCDYIMRALLAVSALHLAYHRPDMRIHYQTLAASHHQLATKEASKQQCYFHEREP
jgi:hypothetical protein